MLYRKYQNPKRRGRRGASFLRLVIFLLALLLPLELVARPVMDRALVMQGERILTQVLAEETLALLQNEEVSYNRLCRLQLDSSGKITAVETDAAQINRIKSELQKNVTARLSLLAEEELSLPLGTLLQSPFLLGRGPVVSLRVQPLGLLQSQIQSSFSAAGVNQTSHRLILSLTLRADILLPLHRAQTEASSDFLLAETVIVGDVPEYYTLLNDSAGSADPLDPLLAGMQRSN